MENNNEFYANGILWSSCKGYYKEILLELSRKYKVEQIAIFNLENQYTNFIIECYQHDEDVMSDGYIEEKIKRLLQDDSTIIVAFTLFIKNPQYKYSAKGNLQCIQARSMKELIKKNFSEKVKNYFLDNIIHLADNEYETKILENLFNKYQKCAFKGYLSKGYNPSYAIELYEKDKDLKIRE